MLDKSKIYVGYCGDRRKEGQPPAGNLKRVKILYEDDVSYYVENLLHKDARGHQKRFSVKKHCFILVEAPSIPTIREVRICIRETLDMLRPINKEGLGMLDEPISKLSELLANVKLLEEKVARE
jgi:hypothetical protein